jgi:hypothetical protein
MTAVDRVELPERLRILVVAPRRLGYVLHRKCLDELSPPQVIAAVDQALAAANR